VAAQAAIGAGLGSLTTLAYIYFFGFTALDASATKRLPALIMTVISLAVFIYYSLVDFSQGGTLLLGSLVGGYAGAHVAIKQGNQYVKIALAIVLVALGIRFIFGA